MMMMVAKKYSITGISKANKRKENGFDETDLIEGKQEVPVNHRTYRTLDPFPYFL